jgi:hypothetical protein
LFWEWEWEVSTLSNNSKTKVSKDPGIMTAQGRSGPIIAIGWLLLSYDDELQNKNVYLADSQKFTCGIIFCSLEIFSCSLKILGCDWFGHNMV